MPDNFETNSASGGVTFASDEISTVHHQRVKIQTGADGSATDVSATNPLPIEGPDAENAAVSGNPLLAGGRYDASPRTLGDGDVGAVALDADGAVHISDGGNTLTVDGTVTANAGTGTFTVDNGGTFAVQADSTVTDDAAYTAGSGQGVAIMGFATSDSVDSGDIGALAMDTARNLKVSIEADNAGVGGGTQYAVDTALGATPTGTLAVGKRDDALSSLTPVEGDAVELRVDANGALWTVSNQDVMLGTDFSSVLGTSSLITGTQADNLANTTDGLQTTGLNYYFDGSSWDRVRGDQTDGMLVNLGSNNDVINSGTFAVQEDGAALTALQLIDNVVATDGSTSPTQGNMVCGHDGTNAQRIATDTSGNLQIDVISSIPAGTNNIGDVDVDSVVPGTAATNLGKAQDSAVGSTDTGVAMLLKRDDEQSAVTPVDGDYVVPTVDKFGKTKVTLHPDATSEPKRAVIDAASSGDNTLVAAAGAGIKIRVTSAFMVSAGTVNVRFESGASGTALTGQMNLVANTGFVLPFNPDGWFETSDNALLNLELSAAVSVDGALTYVEV